ncbi:diacylglycerol kinase family lipid kinase [Paenibacillus spiritus]|uniref:Diacylglycerol kinase family lipid kinase n=2 Tax=Paenibacillus spiritus TaxID=2496557 RepID=A0A5J5FUN8_9BACL|nr:diacylglycerol kinase family lipid kinase [Paenibacillus spiritus]
MYLFIINPRAGGGAAAKVWQAAQETLRERSVSYEALLTGSAETAGAEIARALGRRAGAWTAAVVIGGDGTLHSALGAIAAHGVPLGIVPAGSGNDTARGFGVPLDAPKALEAALAGCAAPADMLRAGSRNTVTAVASGFDAQVAVNVNRSRYKAVCNALRAGRLAYLIGVLHTLATFKPCRARVVCGGEERFFEDVWLASVCNLPSYGGGLRIAPQADSADGLLDVCVVHGIGRWKLLRLFPTLLRGSHVKLPYVTMLRGAEAEIAFERPMPAIGDGEPLPAGPLAVRCEPGALRVLSPPAARAASAADSPRAPGSEKLLRQPAG